MPAHREGNETERRGQILDAAAAVFARLGLQRARVDDVVNEAGLGKGTIYWYFKSKDELIQGLLHRLFGGYLNDLRTLELADGAVSERFLGFVRRYARSLQGMRWLMPLTLDFYALSSHHAWARDFLRDYYAEFRVVVQTLVQQGIERGEFQPAPLDDTATALIALMEGATLMWLLDGGETTLERRSLFAAQLILDGLRVRGAPADAADSPNARPSSASGDEATQ